VAADAEGRGVCNAHSAMARRAIETEEDRFMHRMRVWSGVMYLNAGASVVRADGVAIRELPSNRPGRTGWTTPA